MQFLRIQLLFDCYSVHYNISKSISVFFMSNDTWLRLKVQCVVSVTHLSHRHTWCVLPSFCVAF